MAVIIRNPEVDRTTEQQLIERARRGDRQAYGQIVERYQNLVCSVAYSACGDLSQSEDLAQETFVAAWRQLPALRDIGSFGSWLCGIVRNLGANLRRRDARRGPTASLEGLEPEPSAPDATPEQEAISQEEEGLVWHSLESIPETYRTPLVLFYRQDQSIEEVARALDLTNETARQRLSRGRALLREKVQGMVERSLTRSRPGKAFTLATLAALPALAAPVGAATGVSAATAATTAAKGASLSFWGALLGPLAGILGGVLGSRAAIANARSPRERALLVRMSWTATVLALAFAASLLLVIFYAAELRARSEGLFAALLGTLVVVHGGGITALVLVGNRRLRALVAEEEGEDEAAPPAASPTRPGREYRSRWTLLGLPLVHVALGTAEPGQRYRRAKAVGWIAIGDLAYGVLLSIGGIAVGGIAIGGISAGLIAIAGLAAGGVALGGVGLGWIGLGGMALAWDTAFGGLAIAAHYAVGGMAIATEANTEAAKQLLTENPILVAGKALLDHSRWFVILAVVPLMVALRPRKNPR